MINNDQFSTLFFCNGVALPEISITIRFSLVPCWLTLPFEQVDD